MSAFTEAHAWCARLNGKYRAIRPLRWEIGIKGSGLWVTVPAGFDFDVSIPRAARWFFNPHDYRYLKAAALHDHMLDQEWDAQTAAAIFYRALRASRNFTPILMLTARQLRADVIEGLDAGADDYLTKPFDLGELLARVQSLMRRRQWFEGGETANQTLEFGDVRVDFRNLKATVRGRRAKWLVMNQGFWSGPRVVLLTRTSIPGSARIVLASP